MRTKIALWLTAITLIFTLNACTSTRLAYNNASVVLNYYLDDYVDLSAKQKTWLSPRWTKLVEWHRATELPIYKKLLLQSKEQLNRPVTAADFEAIGKEFKASASRIADFFLPDIVEFVGQLSPAQIDYLERKLEKENAKRAKELVASTDERKKRQLERNIKHFEEDFGKLAPKQTAKITEVVSATPLLDESRHAQSKRGQAEMLKMLREHSKEPGVISAAIKTLIATPEARRSPAYQAQIADEERQMLALNIWLINSASPKQKEKLIAQVEGYVDDVTGLLNR